LALGLSPFVLGFVDHDIALWTSIVLGVIVVVISIIGLSSKAMDKRWMYWVIGLTGLAAFIAPFVFGFSDHAEPLWTGLLLGGGLAVLDGVYAFRPPPVMEPQH
jgi:hypothetical protein